MERIALARIRLIKGRSLCAWDSCLGNLKRPLAPVAGAAAGDADAAGAVPPQRLPHHGAGRHLEPALDPAAAVPRYAFPWFDCASILPWPWQQRLHLQSCFCIGSCKVFLKLFVLPWGVRLSCRPSSFPHIAHHLAECTGTVVQASSCTRGMGGAARWRMWAVRRLRASPLWRHCRCCPRSWTRRTWWWCRRLSRHHRRAPKPPLLRVTHLLDK